MKGKIRYFLLLHIVLVIYSSTSIASKLASGAGFLSLKFIFFYGLAIAGLGVYAIMWQQVIKHLPLITAYANKAVTVIWGIVFGYFVFDEAITLRKILGAMVIIAGVYFIVTADDLDEKIQSKQEVAASSDKEKEGKDK